MQTIFVHRATRITTLSIARIAALLAVLALATLLGGCAGMRIVDSDVTAYPVSAQPSIVLPAAYRFERLPSEQAQGQARQALEALAEPELAKVGLRHDDGTALYSVQLDLRMFRDPQAPWYDPRYTGGFATPFPVMTRYGTLWRMPSLDMRFDFPYYRREIHVVVRRLSDNQVVFESRANHDGRWADSQNVIPAMLQAALQGFPNPPAGMRRVNVEIPR